MKPDKNNVKCIVTFTELLERPHSVIYSIKIIKGKRHYCLITFKSPNMSTSLVFRFHSEYPDFSSTPKGLQDPSLSMGQKGSKILGGHKESNTGA